MYSGRHDEALADYSLAIELEPEDAGLWRRRAHAHTIAPTPQPEKGIEDATRAIELAPDHHRGGVRSPCDCTHATADAGLGECPGRHRPPH